MALTGHTAQVVGTQTRGSAVGTRKQWTAPNDVSIAAGVDSIVAELFVPDALALSLQWDVKATSADGIEKATVLVSQDGSSFEEVWSQTYDPDVAPAAPNNVHNFISVNGWDFDYVQVKLKSKTGGGGSDVRCHVTDSIFTGGHLHFFEPTTPGSVVNFEDRMSHVYTSGVVYNDAISATEQPSSEITLAGPRSFNLELGIKLTSWSSLATLTIRPEIYLGGEWRSLTSTTVTAGVQSVAGYLTIQIAITGNLNTSLSVGGGGSVIVAERYRFFINGDTADGSSLELFALAKVPY